MKKPYQERQLEKRIKTAYRKVREASKRYNSALTEYTKLEAKLDRMVAARLHKEEEAAKSFGVTFVRRNYIRKIKGVNGWECMPGNKRISSRRFKARKEANHHGKRFTKIEGHKSFSVFESHDPVNAYINWRTGKTNPLIGLRRTNR